MSDKHIIDAAASSEDLDWMAIYPSRSSKILSVNVSGLSKDAENHDNNNRSLRFENLQYISFEASCPNWIFKSCKDDPVRDLAKGIRGVVTASPTVYIQLDCVVHGLTYCSFAEFNWETLDDALFAFSEGHARVDVLVRFPRRISTEEEFQVIAYTPPGFLNQLLPMSTRHPNIQVINEPPTVIVDPDMMYYVCDLN
ncbi:hypothetical protein BKA70DRAFT_1220257 [Coprinopsis sp. MPI-PUGE-AT-0042]|nr:hypothetical protein BKA70DRAFT_1220257 [Coprinopsis sp. MPI-PUGE-AT-0042]